jgi:hypothetical protein
VYEVNSATESSMIGCVCFRRRRGGQCSFIDRNRSSSKFMTHCKAAVPLTGAILRSAAHTRDAWLSDFFWQSGAKHLRSARPESLTQRLIRLSYHKHGLGGQQTLERESEKETGGFVCW